LLINSCNGAAKVSSCASNFNNYLQMAAVILSSHFFLNKFPSSIIPRTVMNQAAIHIMALADGGRSQGMD